MNPELVKKFYEHLKVYGSKAPEECHILERDVILQIFKDFSTNKVSKKDMVEMSKIMIDISKLPHPRWFA